jgi:hypothetical protein
MIHGGVPSGIGNMTSLSYFDLSHNKLDGVLSEEHLASLVNLERLDLSQNSLKLKLGKDWVPPFRLTLGYFGSCDMGPWFPRWLRWQTSLAYLNISDESINDVLPQWFWVVSSNAHFLDLSRNGLSGNLPARLELPFIEEMDLSGIVRTTASKSHSSQSNGTPSF